MENQNVIPQYFIVDLFIMRAISRSTLHQSSKNRFFKHDAVVLLYSSLRESSGFPNCYDIKA